MFKVLEEEDYYFKNIIKDAIKDLQEYGSTYVFSKEQVSAVKEIMQADLIVKFDGSFYKIDLKK